MSFSLFISTCIYFYYISLINFTRYISHSPNPRELQKVFPFGDSALSSDLNSSDGSLLDQRYEPGPGSCDSDASYTPEPVLQNVQYFATDMVQQNTAISPATGKTFRNRIHL